MDVQNQLRGVFYWAIVLCLAPCVARGAEVSTTGVYDAAGGNEVERNGNGNAIGATGPNDYLGFKTDLAAAFAANRGGVIPFAETIGVVGTGDNVFEARYGTLADKILTVNSSAIHNTTTSATFGSTLSSGTQYLVTTNTAGNGPNFTLSFGAVTGGSPGEFVQRVAVTILDKNVAVSTDLTLTAMFSNGQSSPMIVNMPGDGTTLTDTFVAFSAPAGASITSLAFEFPGTNTNTSRFGIDEVAFITAVPEPGASAVFVACAAALCLRRRRA